MYICLCIYTYIHIYIYEDIYTHGYPAGSMRDKCGVRGGADLCVDCAGVPFGLARLDKCRVCGGADLCVDCAGVPFGSSSLLACGCNDGNSCVGKGIVPAAHLYVVGFSLACACSHRRSAHRCARVQRQEGYSRGTPMVLKGCSRVLTRYSHGTAHPACESLSGAGHSL